MYIKTGACQLKFGLSSALMDPRFTISYSTEKIIPMHDLQPPKLKRKTKDASSISLDILCSCRLRLQNKSLEVVLA